MPFVTDNASQLIHITVREDAAFPDFFLLSLISPSNPSIAHKLDSGTC
jgi:hypothetical protein